MPMRTIDSEGGDMPRVFREVLKALARNRDDQRVRIIAADTGYSPGYVWKVIRKMAGKGLITINSDPGCMLDIDIPTDPQQ
jgi:CTP:molybdopterin cytidylyltransferase MocA